MKTIKLSKNTECTPLALVQYNTDSDKISEAATPPFSFP